MNNRWFVLVLLPILGGCISDVASWQIEGKDHALTLFRDQKWLWSSTVDLAVVAARLPECQRRHFLEPASTRQASVDVYQIGDNEFILKQGARLYRIETRSCTGFQKLDAPPAGGLGVRMGGFREQDGKLRFVAEGKG